MRKHTVIGGKDRCDYRAMSTRELIEEAKYTPNIELCIALGERLEKNEREKKEREKVWAQCPDCMEVYEA